MRHALIPLAFSLGASAAALKKGNDCHTEIHAHGHAHGTIGELSDGQCRIGGGYAPVHYHLNKHTGILTNSKGWGCILAGEPQQIQCDSGKPGTPTWSVGSDGWLKHDGCSDFYACPVTDHNEWNIYKRPIAGQDKCVHITLSSSCHNWEGPPPPPQPTHTPKCCEECQPKEYECKKTCYEKPQKHHAAPTSYRHPKPSQSPRPKCCEPQSKGHKDDSHIGHSGHDEQSETNCRADCESDGKPRVVSDVEKREVTSVADISSVAEVNSPANVFASSFICGDCPERDHGCKKNCRNDCHDCKKDDDKCKHSCISRCHRCREGEQDCKKGCARPYLEPANCRVCRPRDDLCWETCYKDGHKYDDKNAISEPKWCGDCDDDDLPCQTRCYRNKDRSQHEGPDHEHNDRGLDGHGHDEHENPQHVQKGHSKCDGDCSLEKDKHKQPCHEKECEHKHENKPESKHGDKHNDKHEQKHEQKKEDDCLKPKSKCEPQDKDCHKTCSQKEHHKEPSKNKEHEGHDEPKEHQNEEKKPYCHESSHTSLPCTTSFHHHETPHSTSTPCTTSSYHKEPHWTSAPSASSHPKPCPWHQTSHLPPAPGQQYGACPANIDGEHQIPHLIVQVDSQYPSHTYGTGYNGKISASKSTLFKFDVPASYAGKTCSLFFLLPKHEDLQTSSYQLSGSGLTHWDALWSSPTPGTSYATKPGKALHLNDFPLAPGTNYWVADHPCPAGQSVGFEMSGSGIDLEYFQDYNPKPIGLYMRAC